MSNAIIRPLANGLGFDKYGQLTVEWHEGESTYSTFIADMRGLKCPICGKGWEVTAESFRNQYRHGMTGEWIHRTCWVGYLAMDEAEFWTGLLSEHLAPAGIHFKWAKVPNEYGGAWNTPWYLVQFRGYVPKMKMGSRKRVCHMELFDLCLAQTEMFLPMMEHEDVTKGAETTRIYAHAWSREKAREYFEFFMKILQTDQPIQEVQQGEQLFDTNKK